MVADEEFKESVDAWIKELKKKVIALNEQMILNDMDITENYDNTQHNYELIYEFKDQIEELKHELNALKIIQIISLKHKVKEENQKSI